ncbi:MAG: UDP-N-acetylmuramoyl-tripeptide--D-alanyl-D-alanine ligase [Myxococcota bacterium]
MTPPFDAQQIVEWTGGQQLRGRGDESFEDVSIDSRRLRGGELFVAIRGPNHDGHGFLAQALAAGAKGLLVAGEKQPEISIPSETVVIRVVDTTRALGALAAGFRRGFGGPVIAVTGSNGKTTTKEMCAAILSVRGPCLKNEGNLNNEFGLPLTLLARRPEHLAAVVELGMNHRGEIARLAAIARPDVAVVTNVGTAHIEFLASREEIAREKGDLLAALDPDGVAVINRDDPLVVGQVPRTTARVMGFGRGPEAEVRSAGVRDLDEGAYTFDLQTPEGSTPVRVAGLGETTVINALAAAAAALAAGASLEDVATGLGRHQPIRGRMARLALAGEITLIDDSYNANPQSVRAALESLARHKGTGRGVAVLGDMGELGEAAEEAHRNAGREAAELGIDFLIALGDYAELLADAAVQSGMDGRRVRVAKEHDQVNDALLEILRPRDWVLVKGSRAMKMERVVETLVARKEA